MKNRVLNFLNSGLTPSAFRPSSTRWLAFAAFSALLIVSRLYHPQDDPKTTLCIFKTVVGLPCPGCGLTRSFCALAKGELARGFHFNLLGPVLFGGLLIGWLTTLLAGVGISAPYNACARWLAKPELLRWALISVIIFWCCRLTFTLLNDGVAATLGRGTLAQFFH